MNIIQAILEIAMWFAIGWWVAASGLTLVTVASGIIVAAFGTALVEGIFKVFGGKKQ